MKSTFFVFISLGFLSLLLSQCKPSVPLNPSIEKAQIMEHIAFLASDSLGGRDTGSPQEAVAARYIADHFERYGLEPIGTREGYFHEFPVTKGVHAVEGENFVKVGSEASLEGVPLGVTASKRVNASLHFVGYGISGEDLRYDDYRRQDVKGKIVVMMPYGPDGNSNPHGTFGAYWDIHSKINRAVTKGAIGVILLTPTSFQEEVLKTEKKLNRSSYDIPILQLDASATKTFMEFLGLSLDTLQKGIDTKQKPNSFPIERRSTLSAKVKEDRVLAKNVLGKIPGKDSTMIIIGAHYDHLGMGEHGSLYRGEPQIHNGADDNASGTAGVLELAEWASTRSWNHTLVFMAFSGEEMGLLGSAEIVDSEWFGKRTSRAMINMDMIGRMNGKKLIILGTGSANSWEERLSRLNSDSLSLSFVPDGVGASDHTSFYQKEIPVLHFFTDTHSDYHRPSDDTEYINGIGTQKTLELVSRTLAELDTVSNATFFYTKAPVSQQRSMTMKGPTLGVVPDYGYSEYGMKITGISEGRPAEKAGLQGGDIIIQIGEKKIKDIYAYMEALNGFKKGDATTIKVKRDGEEREFALQF